MVQVARLELQQDVERLVEIPPLGRCLRRREEKQAGLVLIQAALVGPLEMRGSAGNMASITTRRTVRSRAEGKAAVLVAVMAGRVVTQ